MVAISPRRVAQSGVPFICAGGHFAFLILKPGALNSGSSGDSKSSLKERRNLIDLDFLCYHLFYIFKHQTCHNYVSYTDKIKLPLGKKTFYFGYKWNTNKCQ